jgi:hypothetical protein
MADALDTSKQPAIIMGIANIESFEDKWFVIETSLRSEVRCIVFSADCFRQCRDTKLLGPRMKCRERAIRDWG